MSFYLTHTDGWFNNRLLIPRSKIQPDMWITDHGAFIGFKHLTETGSNFTCTVNDRLSTSVISGLSMDLLPEQPRPNQTTQSSDSNKASISGYCAVEKHTFAPDH